MADQNLRGKKVAILATDGVEQSELEEPRKALENAGAQTVLLSIKTGAIQAMNGDLNKGNMIKVDQLIDQADPTLFDAVLLPGGAYNADRLRTVTAAQEFIQEIDETDKPIAVICHAPWLLVSAKLVHGRDLTSYYTLQDDIRNAGGHWLDQEVVRDRNWVSSRNPKDIPAFNRAMLDLFATWQAGKEKMPSEGRQEETHLQHRETEGVRGAGEGSGRVDEVGHSGVYPASDPNAPEDARAQGEASFGQGERGAAGYEDHGDSELNIPPESGKDQV